MSPRTLSYFTWLATIAALAAMFLHDSYQGSAITLINTLLFVTATVLSVFTLVLSKRSKEPRGFLDVLVLLTIIPIAVFGIPIIVLLGILIVVLLVSAVF